MADRILTADQVREMLRRECDKAGGQHIWAKENGVSQPFVNNILTGYRAPGDIVPEILGLTKVVGWRKKRLDEYATKQ